MTTDLLAELTAIIARLEAAGVHVTAEKLWQSTQESTAIILHGVKLEHTDDNHGRLKCV